MASRKAWADLTPAYRGRLERQGITAQSHARANLIRARGHKPPRPAGSIDEALINKVVTGQGSPKDLKNLRRKFVWPAWLPKTIQTEKGGPKFKVSVDVAAALSQLPDPKSWKDVRLTPRDDGQAWTMIVERKGNAYPIEVLIPGGGGPGSGAREVLAILTELEIKKEHEAQKRRREIEAVFFEVLGTDEDE